MACAGRADAGRAATGVALGQGGQAPDAEDQALCGLVAGDGGAHPALQPAMPHVVHAGETATPDARGQTMHGFTGAACPATAGCSCPGGARY